jgi:hypothetical protein
MLDWIVVVCSTYLVSKGGVTCKREADQNLEDQDRSGSHSQAYGIKKKDSDENSNAAGGKHRVNSSYTQLR